MKISLDALSRRNFKTAKFTSLLSLALARLAVLKNQLQVRYKQARNDVVQLLEQGLLERALTRVEHVIRDQNMLDVYVMMENYCNILQERAYLIEEDRECPEELKEAIASLLYSSKRCGEFPELQEMCVIFTSHYGKDFVARAMELRHACGVNPAMIQKLSTRQPADLDSRWKTLKGIASENSIVLQLDEPSPPEEKLRADEPIRPETKNLNRGKEPSLEDLENENFGSSIKTTKKFKDAADAAQSAFESAAYAAAAAKAAVQLSRSEYHDRGKQNSHISSDKGSGSYADDLLESERGSVSQKSEEEKKDIMDSKMAESRDSFNAKGTYSGLETATGQDNLHCGESTSVDSNVLVPPTQDDLKQDLGHDSKRHRNIFSHLFKRKIK